MLAATVHNEESGSSLVFHLREQGEDWEKLPSHIITDTTIQLQDDANDDIEFGTNFEGILHSVEIYTGTVPTIDTDTLAGLHFYFLFKFIF